MMTLATFDKFKDWVLIALVSAMIYLLVGIYRQRTDAFNAHVENYDQLKVDHMHDHEKLNEMEDRLERLERECGK